jgi:dimethylargininase
MTMFKHAIVRPPSRSFACGLTSAHLGAPDLPKALAQHAAYCSALERCGLALIRLAPLDDFPDSTFVEDTAVVTEHCAILTYPGAASRKGEVALNEPTLRSRFERVHCIEPPGTMDGGDVCQAGNHFFIGISERTNKEGARQLAALLAPYGYSCEVIDVRDVPGILHLKTGISWLGDNRITAIDTMADLDAFRDFEIVRLHPRENYAANCLRINDYVVISQGFPRFESAVRELGYPVLALDMSEFRKMDGSLSCTSIRF